MTGFSEWRYHADFPTNARSHNRKRTCRQLVFLRVAHCITHKVGHKAHRVGGKSRRINIRDSRSSRIATPMTFEYGRTQYFAILSGLGIWLAGSARVSRAFARTYPQGEPRGGWTC
jgi:hypothetical protein